MYSLGSAMAQTVLTFFFFFSIVGFDFFFPRNWFYLMYPSLKFSIKKKISIKKKECKKENGNNNE